VLGSCILVRSLAVLPWPESLLVLSMRFLGIILRNGWMRILGARLETDCGWLRQIGRAFSPCASYVDGTQGDALGWDDGAPLALKSRFPGGDDRQKSKGKNGAGFCGFPPLPQRRRQGWGTQFRRLG
jgi:hypothetical protein